jgi:hypothetical protein
MRHDQDAPIAKVEVGALLMSAMRNSGKSRLTQGDFP